MRAASPINVTHTSRAIALPLSMHNHCIGCRFGPVFLAVQPASNPQYKAHLKSINYQNVKNSL